MHYLTKEYAIQKALRSTITAKLTPLDLNIFHDLLRDIFSRNDVAKNIENSFSDNQTQETTLFIEKHQFISTDQKIKIHQLYESLCQRTGCLVMGPSGSCKSFYWKTLRDILIRSGNDVSISIINPKSMDRRDLFGSFDCDTREWIDGVLTRALRKSPPDRNSLKWIIFDGDIDPEWIEALNSALDDNKLLTLPNGERVSLGDKTSFIFETDSLEYASPATISRMGIICLSEDNTNLRKEVVSKWLHIAKNENSSKLKHFVDKYLLNVLDLTKNSHFSVDMSDISILQNCLGHIESSTTIDGFLGNLFRGISSCMYKIERDKFASTFISHISKIDKNEYQIDETLKNEKNNTSDLSITHSYNVFLKSIEIWIQQKNNFMVIGPEGCGKVACLKYAFSKIPDTKIRLVSCNAQTRPIDLIDIIKAECSPFTQSNLKIFRPNKTSNLVIILKYITAIPLDKYKSNMMESFLQYLLSYDGFYDGLDFYKIESTQIVLCLNQSSRKVHRRLISRFRISVFDEPKKSEIEVITRNLLERYCKDTRNIDFKSYAKVMTDIYEIVSLEIDSQRDPKYYLSLDSFEIIAKNLARHNTKIERFSSYFLYELHRVIGDQFDSEFYSSEKLSSLFLSTIQKYIKDTISLKDGYFFTFTGEPGILKTSQAKDCLSSFPRTEDFANIVKKWSHYYKREDCAFPTLTLDNQFLSFIQKIEHGLICSRQHIILAGRSGMGRKTATKLTCFMNNIRFVSLIVTNPWNLSHFRNQVKKSIIFAAINCEKICLYLEDYQLTEQLMISTIANLISTGTGETRLEDFFSQDELENNLSYLTDSTIGSRHKNTKSLFLTRLRKNLHICFSLDTTSDNFKYLFIGCPSLRKSCSLKFCEWTPDTIHAYSTHVVLETMKNCDVKQKQKQISLINSQMTQNRSIVDRMKKIYEVTKILKSCPNSFRRFLEIWQRIYEEKFEELLNEYHRLKKGIEKLIDTNKIVDNLRDKAGKQKKKLNIAQSEADNAMSAITEELAKSESKRIEINDLQGRLSAKSENTLVKKKSIEEELSKIQPILEKAKYGATIKILNFMHATLFKISNMKNHMSPIYYLF